MCSAPLKTNTNCQKVTAKGGKETLAKLEAWNYIARK